MLNRKITFISVLALLSVSFVFVGCLPPDAQLFFYSEKYDLFFPAFPQNQYQAICYKFALPFHLPPGHFTVKGQLKTGMTITPGQIASRLEVKRKGQTIFSDDEVGNYDSNGRFHGTFDTNNPADFKKNDVIIFSFAPMSQSFTDVHFKFTFTSKF